MRIKMKIPFNQPYRFRKNRGRMEWIKRITMEPSDNNIGNSLGN
jgi:hypothetical protein